MATKLYSILVEASHHHFRQQVELIKYFFNILRGVMEVHALMVQPTFFVNIDFQRLVNFFKLLQRLFYHRMYKQ